MVGRRAHDDLAGRGLAGERDHRHVGMGDERRTGLLADAVDDVEHARREPGLLHDLGQQAADSGDQLGRLDHDRAPGGEARRELPGREHERHVPRGDQAGDAAWTADDISELSGAAEGVLVHRRHVGEVAEVLRRAGRHGRGPGSRAGRCRTSRTPRSPRRGPRSRRRSASAPRNARRDGIVAHPLVSNARRAAATARSTSADVPLATVA